MMKEQGKYVYHSNVTGDDSNSVENNFNLYSKLDTVIHVFPRAYHDDKILCDRWGWMGLMGGVRQSPFV